jgi:hypothetical protein
MRPRPKSLERRFAEDSQLVRAAPPLDHFAVLKSRDLNPARANLPSRRSYAHKFALVRAGHRVRNGYLVLVGYSRSSSNFPLFTALPNFSCTARLSCLVMTSFLVA